MKKLFRIVIIVSVAMAVLAAAGCGGKQEDPDSGSGQQESHVEILGEEKTWGSFRVFIPDGMELTGGSLIDMEDPDSLWIQPEKFGLEAFQIIRTDKNTADNDIKSAKNSYETTDIRKFSAGEWNWSGISYKSGDTAVQILKCTSGGNCIEVIITGYAFDSDLSMAVLSGIHLLQ